MKARFAWLPPVAVALVAPAPAWATVYLDVAQAQTLLFPGRALVPVALTLDAEQARAIRQRSGVRVEDREVRAWRADDGGWFILDRVIGKHEYIDYAVALDRSGGVAGVEILQYREAYGEEIRRAGWRAHFVGKHDGDAMQADRDVPLIAGATLSCKHVTDGVRRVLALHALVLAGR